MLVEDASDCVYMPSFYFCSAIKAFAFATSGTLLLVGVLLGYTKLFALGP